MRKQISVKKQLENKGMSFEQIKKKFKTTGEMKAFYKKHGVTRYNLKLN